MKLWVAPRHVLGYTIQLQPVFAQFVQNIQTLAPGSTAPNQLEPVSYVLGRVVAVAGKISMMPMALGTADL